MSGDSIFPRCHRDRGPHVSSTVIPTEGFSPSGGTCVVASGGEIKLTVELEKLK